jgi:hypothetical protein
MTEPHNKVALAKTDYQRVERMAASGWRLKDIATALNLSVRGLDGIRKRDPELEAAIERGRGKEHQKLVAKLFDVATKGTGKEAVTAAIFLLKARHGYREGHAIDGDAGSVNVQINLPGAMTPDQYRDLVKVQPRVIDTEAEHATD